MDICIIQVENTIRWRHARDEHGNVKYDELGNQVKESNARVVRWSDGRYVLFSCIYSCAFKNSCQSTTKKCLIEQVIIQQCC